MEGNRTKTRVIFYSPYFIVLAGLVFTLMFVRNWNLKAQNAAFETEASELQERLDAQTQTITTLKGSVETKNQALTACTNEKDTLAKQSASKDEAVAAKAAEAAAATQERDALKAQVDEATNKCAAEKAELEKAKGEQLAKKDEEVAQRDAQIKTLTDDLAKAKAAAPAAPAAG